MKMDGVSPDNDGTAKKLEEVYPPSDLYQKKPAPSIFPYTNLPLLVFKEPIIKAKKFLKEVK